MVKFTNIYWDDDWIYADAYCLDLNASCRLKVHRREDKFEILEGEFRGFIVACSWYLAKDLESKGTISEPRTVMTH